MKTTSRIIAALAVSITAIGSARADDGDWTNIVTPYLWFTALQGRTSIGTPNGDIGTDFDVSASDLFKNLKLGGMLNYRGQTDDWAVIGDVLYANVKQNGSRTGEDNIATAYVTAQEKLTVFEVDAGYRITPQVLAFIGGRYFNVNANLQAHISGENVSTPIQQGSKSSDWIDPVIGGVGDFAFGDHWGVHLRADVGGFGVGAKFSYQLEAGVGYKFNELFSMLLGYEYLREENSKGVSGTDTYFQYDAALKGPALAFSFTF